MQLWFWIVLGLVFKIPVVGMCWICWWAIKNPPEQVLGDEDGGMGTRYGQGPRLRGPRPGTALWPRGDRRSDPGHDEAPLPAPGQPAHAPAGTRRGE